jgi:hypothetical protein
LVSPAVQQFISDLQRPGLRPYLKLPTSSSATLRSNAEDDISKGILNMKDFDQKIEDDSVLLQKFTDVYVNALQSVRLSAVDIFNRIRDTVGEIQPYLQDTTAFTLWGIDQGTMVSEMATLSIVQAVQTAYLETNNAYQILKNNLFEISLQFKYRGKTSTTSPEMKALQQLATQLEATTAGRELLKELYFLGVPKIGDLASYLPRVAGGILVVPTIAATEGVTTTGTDQWDYYGRNWIMVIDSHIKALEGLEALYEMGGDAVDNLYGPGTIAADAEEYLEEAIARSHDSIKNRLFDIFRELYARALTTADPLIAAQWTVAYNAIYLASIPGAPSVGLTLPKFDNTFSRQLTAIKTLKAAAVAGFTVPVPLHVDFGL